jgi:hypothetical protein
MNAARETTAWKWAALAAMGVVLFLVGLLSGRATAPAGDRQFVVRLESVRHAPHEIPQLDLKKQIEGETP